MFKIQPFVYLICVSLIFADDVFQCAITVGNHTDGDIITCDPGVNHCITFVSGQSDSHRYVQQGRGCMPWNQLIRRCPSIPGVCHILHETRDGLNKTCCCKGNMCNAKTVKLVAIEYNDGPTDAASEDLANFGLVHSFTTNSTVKQTIHPYALPISVICIFVLLLMLCLILVVKCVKSTSPDHHLHPLLCFKRKPACISSAEKSNGQIGQPHTTAQQQRSRSLLHRVLVPSSASTNTPLLACNEAGSRQHLVDDRDGALYPLGNHPSYPLCLIDVVKIRAAEKMAMQHIVENCQKVHLVDRGRFAEVWSASLPTTAIQEVALRFSAALGNTVDPDGDSRGASDQQDNSALLDTANSEDITRCIGSGSSVPLGRAEERTTHDPHLLDSDQTVLNEDRILLTKPSLPTLGECHDVAIKVFPANEQRAWSAELTIFRALQEPIGYQLLSSTRDKTSVSFADLLPHSQGAISEPLAHTTACSSGLSRTTDNANENPGASFGCTVSRQARRYNLVQMLAAGVITDDNSATQRQTESTHLLDPSEVPSRLVREYRLVLEYAAGGSLRSLLTSGQWLAISRLLQISRDIARGISFMHSDVSLERSAIRGSLAKLSIAHRDLKPENILLRADGSACLSDFGQATVVTDTQSEYSQPPVGSGLTSGANYWLTGVTRPAGQPGRSNLECMSQAGTLRYMAPELLDGAINFTGTSLLRTDIYSLGLVFWELLTAVYLPDQPVSVTPGPSYRQPTSRHHDSPPVGKWFPSPDVTVEEDEDGGLTTVPATECLGRADIFGRGFLMLTSGWHSSNLLSTLAVQQPQHIVPSPPDKSRRPRHYLPYELELASASGHQPANLLRKLVVADKYRPLANHLWTYNPVLSQLYRTVTECWDPEPEARLTADCILERINILMELLKRYLQLSDQ